MQYQMLHIVLVTQFDNFPALYVLGLGPNIMTVKMHSFGLTVLHGWLLVMLWALL